MEMHTPVKKRSDKENEMTQACVTPIQVNSNSKVNSAKLDSYKKNRDLANQVRLEKEKLKYEQERRKQEFIQKAQERKKRQAIYSEAKRTAAARKIQQVREQKDREIEEMMRNHHQELLNQKRLAEAEKREKLKAVKHEERRRRIQAEQDRRRREEEAIREQNNLDLETAARRDVARYLERERLKKRQSIQIRAQIEKNYKLKKENERKLKEINEFHMYQLEAGARMDVAEYKRQLKEEEREILRHKAALRAKAKAREEKQKEVRAYHDFEMDELEAGARDDVEQYKRGLKEHKRQSIMFRAQLIAESKAREEVMKEQQAQYDAYMNALEAGARYDVEEYKNSLKEHKRKSIMFRAHLLKFNKQKQLKSQMRQQRIDEYNRDLEDGARFDVQQAKLDEEEARRISDENRLLQSMDISQRDLYDAALAVEERQRMLQEQLRAKENKKQRAWDHGMATAQSEPVHLDEDTIMESDYEEEHDEEETEVHESEPLPQQQKRVRFQLPKKDTVRHKMRTAKKKCHQLKNKMPSTEACCILM